MIRRFDDFLAGANVVIRRGGEPQRIVEAMRGLLRQLLERRDWLAPELARPVREKPYTQYLLYLPPEESWSVVSFVWPAGSTTPIHDHGAWGVVGVYQGEETETTYRPVEPTEDVRGAGPVRLEKGAATRMVPGDVATVVPPDDIHAVANRGTITAVSIHVYGCNIGKQPRRTFRLPDGRVKPFVSGYDIPPERVDGPP